MREEVIQLIDEETYEEIIRGIHERVSDNSWTILCDVSDNVLDKLLENGYQVKKNLTNVEIGW